jgi:hypothetical protein
VSTVSSGGSSPSETWFFTHKYIIFL